MNKKIIIALSLAILVVGAAIYIKAETQNNNLEKYQSRLNILADNIKTLKNIEPQETFQETLKIIHDDIDANLKALKDLKHDIKDANFTGEAKTSAQRLLDTIKSLRERLKQQKIDEGSKEKKETFYNIKRNVLEPKITALIEPLQIELAKQNIAYWGNMATMDKIEAIHQKMEDMFQLFKKDDFYHQNMFWIKKQEEKLVMLLHEFAESMLDNQKSDLMIFVSAHKNKPAIADAQYKVDKEKIQKFIQRIRKLAKNFPTILKTKEVNKLADKMYRDAFPSYRKK